MTLASEVGPRRQGGFPTANVLAEEFGWLGLLALIGAVCFDFFFAYGELWGDLILGGVSAILLVLSLVAVANRIPRSVRAVTPWLLSLFGLYALRSLGGMDMAGLRHAGQILLLSGVFSFFCVVGLEKGEGRSSLRFVAWVFCAALVGNGLLRMEEFEQFEVVGKNVFGALVLYSGLMAAFLGRRRWHLAVALGIIALVGLLIGQRLLVALTLAFACVFGAGGLLRRNRGLAWLALASAAGMVTGAVLVFSSPWVYQDLGPLSEGIRDLTGRGIFSGREELWPLILLEIREQPLLGHGPGTTPASLLQTRLSAHNYYLQLLLQSGILGLVLFGGLVVGLWRLVLRHTDEFMGRFGLALLVCIVLHQAFEVTILQNALVVAVLQWALLGMIIRDPRADEVLRA